MLVCAVAMHSLMRIELVALTLIGAVLLFSGSSGRRLTLATASVSSYLGWALLPYGIHCWRAVAAAMRSTSWIAGLGRRVRSRRSPLALLSPLKYVMCLAHSACRSCGHRGLV